MVKIKPSITRRMILSKVPIKVFNVPCLDKKTTFVQQFEGPGDYRAVMQNILNNKIAKLSLPDGEKTSFLLHAAYCGPEKFRAQLEVVEIRDKIMRPRYLWISQINKWIPEKYKSAHGVFVIYDEKGEGLSRKIEELDIGELEKALKGGRKLKNGIKFSEDGKINFAPRDTYKSGQMEYGDFAKDGFIIVSFKETGARNLAEVSQSDYFIDDNLCSYIIEPDKEPIQTLSALADYSGGRLDLDGDARVGGGGGCAFGVLE